MAGASSGPAAGRRSCPAPAVGGLGGVAPRPPRTSRGFESSKCLTGRDTKISNLIITACN